MITVAVDTAKSFWISAWVDLILVSRKQERLGSFKFTGKRIRIKDESKENEKRKLESQKMMTDNDDDHCGDSIEDECK